MSQMASQCISFSSCSTSVTTKKQIVRIECFKHKKAGLTAGERRARYGLEPMVYGLGRRAVAMHNPNVPAGASKIAMVWLLCHWSLPTNTHTKDTHYIDTHTHTQTQTQTQPQTQTQTQTQTHVKTYIRAHIHTRMHACMHAYVWNTFMHMVCKS